MKKSIAIIPARGGSKRIPRKNIKPFLGKPIIFYSIEAAINSEIYSKIIVSTDDDETSAIIAQKYPDIEIFNRSQGLANDQAPVDAAIAEALSSVERERISEYVSCIYATAPFISANLLRNSYEKLLESTAQALLPVSEFHYPIQRSLKIDEGYIEMVNPKNAHVRSQDLERRYHDAGLFWMMESSSVLAKKPFYSVPTLGIIIPDTQTHDIDTISDWKIAEMKYQFLESGEK